jgi:hypothetical protein
MRAIIGILLALFMMAMSGCAGPRMVGMYWLGRDQVPVIPEGKLERLEPYWTAQWPGVHVQIRSSKGSRETLDWYMEVFKRNGWEFQSADGSPLVAWDLRNAASLYNAKRERWFLGKTPLLKERMDFDMEGGGDGEPPWIHVYIYTDYFWDAPATAFAKGVDSLRRGPETQLSYALADLMGHAGEGMAYAGLALGNLPLYPLVVITYLI